MSSKQIRKLLQERLINMEKYFLFSLFRNYSFLKIFFFSKKGKNISHTIGSRNSPKTLEIAIE